MIDSNLRDGKLLMDSIREHVNVNISHPYREDLTLKSDIKSHAASTYEFESIAHDDSENIDDRSEWVQAQMNRVIRG